MICPVASERSTRQSQPPVVVNSEELVAQNTKKPLRGHEEAGESSMLAIADGELHGELQWEARSSAFEQRNEIITVRLASLAQRYMSF